MSKIVKLFSSNVSFVQLKLISGTRKIFINFDEQGWGGGRRAEKSLKKV